MGKLLTTFIIIITNIYNIDYYLTLLLKILQNMEFD